AFSVTHTVTTLNDAATAIQFGSTVNAGGKILVSSSTGNVVLADDLFTTSGAADAIVIGAGISGAVTSGLDFKGNVKMAATKSFFAGAGGRALVYSGSVTNTTGFGAAVPSGSGRFRYGVGFNDTSRLPSAGAVYLQYRERPAITLTLLNPFKNYDGN